MSSQQVTVYHNPSCSKSRNTLALLEEQGVEFEVVEYLKTPPDLNTLRVLLERLGVQARDLIREREHSALGLPDTEDEDELLERIARHPRILQRPIVVVNERARIGRPPEKVLEILS